MVTAKAHGALISPLRATNAFTPCHHRYITHRAGSCTSPAAPTYLCHAKRLRRHRKTNKPRVYHTCLKPGKRTSHKHVPATANNRPGNRLNPCTRRLNLGARYLRGIYVKTLHTHIRVRHLHRIRTFAGNPSSAKQFAPLSVSTAHIVATGSHHIVPRHQSVFTTSRIKSATTGGTPHEYVGNTHTTGSDGLSASTSNSDGFLNRSPDKDSTLPPPRASERSRATYIELPVPEKQSIRLTFYAVI